jgi:hypothetical protein
LQVDTSKSECPTACGCRGLVQRKLTIGATNDPMEQEADRVADQVMAMPDHGAISGAPLRIQRFSGQPTGQVAEAPTSVEHTLDSSGRPLEARLRQDMELRFGYDFSQVRVHHGVLAERSAGDINATAYTVGPNVVFGTGSYAPKTRTGRRLIVHELAHVVQQSAASEKKTADQMNNKPVLPSSSHPNWQQSSAGPSAIGSWASRRKSMSTNGKSQVCTVQRKIRVPPNTKLNNLGFNVTRTGDEYSAPRVGKLSIWNEIFNSILASPRLFFSKGNTNNEVSSNLTDHRKSRLAITQLAINARFRFSAPSREPKTEKGKELWELVPDKYGTPRLSVRQGVNQSAAYRDLFHDNPSAYDLACLEAVHYILKAGGKSLYRTEPTPDPLEDWIPGDAGYIENSKFDQNRSKVGTSGENIIYLGGELFWGHDNPPYVASREAWMARVYDWDQGVNLTKIRKYPLKGMI